jgi:hypothetical protein
MQHRVLTRQLERSGKIREHSLTKQQAGAITMRYFLASL